MHKKEENKMLKTDFDIERLIITTSENGGMSEYTYDYFKEDFEAWSKKLKIILASIEHLRRYLLECGYNVIEIKEENKMLMEKLWKEYNLGENLGYEELMLDEILTYSGKIEDAITEIASSHVYIYENQLWKIAPEIRSYIEKSLIEYGPPIELDLLEIFRGGQDFYNRYIFDLNLNKIIWNIAVLKLDEIIQKCTIDLSNYNIVEDMKDYLEIYLNIDSDNYIEDIDDIVEELFNDYLLDNNLKEEV